MADSITLEKMRPSPVVEIPALNKLKRKRTDSGSDFGLSRAQQEKKQRSEDDVMLVQPSTNALLPSKEEAQQTSFTAVAAASSSPSDCSHQHFDPKSPSPSSFTSNDTKSFAPDATSSNMTEDKDPAMADAKFFTPEESRTKLQEVIENEFNLQILMKHNELRLIEQELAKCQVALEQLRRVELRPFPGSDGPVESLSMGTGASILPTSDYARPSYPAPYGVADGPYTRHYNQWLLHDPLFDSTPISSQYYADSMALMAGRSTRNSGTVRKSISKPFTFPARPNEPLQSIPNYPAPVKDKSAPLILKRSTDNQFVKLICNNCQRGNFSSIQGFLNHCRIAHKVDYKSHDAAAIDCGRLLEEHEAINLPSEPTQNTPLHKPSLSRISTAATTPHRNLVHPLNSATGAAAPLGNSSKQTSVPRAAVPGLVSSAGASAKSAFVASTQAPRLSAQFAKYNLGGDLAAAVAGAKRALDLGYDDELDSPDTPDQRSPLDGPNARSANGRAGMTIPGARPPSRKGVRQPQRQPRPSPLTPAQMHHPGSHHQNDSEMPESPPYPSSTATFSPHTADSNPGLVSDHEDDDDHGSASEEEAPSHHEEDAEMPRPFGVAPRTCADNIVIEDAAEDHERIGGGGLIIRRNGLYADEEMREAGAGSKSRKLGLAKRGA